MNYYIQGDITHCSAFKNRLAELGFKTNGCEFADYDCLYFTANGQVCSISASGPIANIIKSHPDYKELELPVEPKFKVHDWIVRNDGSSIVPIQVYGLKKDRYLVTNMLGSKGQVMINRQDEWRLWTIADAKEGDVLLDENTGTIGIFEKIYGTHWYSKIYCGNSTCATVYVDGGAHEMRTKPATKEQRDLLFATIKKVDYEWDEEKKELRKIKPHYDINNFYAGMPVLVRDGDCHEWRYVTFSHYRKVGAPFCAGGQYWFQCIPFNDKTKHLLGTTDMCDEKYINW